MFSFGFHEWKPERDKAADRQRASKLPSLYRVYRVYRLRLYRLLQTASPDSQIERRQTTQPNATSRSRKGRGNLIPSLLETSDTSHPQTRQLSSTFQSVYWFPFSSLLRFWRETAKDNWRGKVICIRKRMKSNKKPFPSSFFRTSVASSCISTKGIGNICQKCVLLKWGKVHVYFV